MYVTEYMALEGYINNRNLKHCVICTERIVVKLYNIWKLAVRV